MSFLRNSLISRRTFMGGAGAVAAATLAGCSDANLQFPSVNTYSDTDILNFALNLEYAEAEFYLRAATGSGLSAADAGGSAAGTVNGGAKITGLTTAQQNFLDEIAYTEQEHVRFLRSTLGSAAVPRPNIDLTAGFTGTVTAANALSSATTQLPAIPTSFSPFANFDSFMVGADNFEYVGMTAYNGAGPLISPAGIAAGLLSAAAGILAVEAYHDAYLRGTLIANAITMGTTAYPYPLYANRIGALRAALSMSPAPTGGSGTTSSAPGAGMASGGTQTELPLGGFLTSAATTSTVGLTTVTPADNNAIAYARTFDQVLHIVYGTFANSNSGGGSTSGTGTTSAGVSKGGFFPNGLNGNIRVTQS